MQFPKEQYRLSWRFLRGPLWSHFINTTIAFFVILLLFFVVALLSPAVRYSMMEYIQSVVENANISDGNGNYSAIAIAVNNLRATALSILYGMLPFLFLPALPIGLNAAVLGSMAAYYQAQDLSMLLLLAGLLPHGIFEIPALLLAFACGLYLCRSITDYIRHANAENFSFSQCAADLARTYLTLIAPLLIVAAVVEAYITPVIMACFL